MWAPAEKIAMRTRISVLVALALVAVACGGRESGDATQSTHDQSSTTTVAAATTEAATEVTSTQPHRDGAPGPEAVAGEHTQNIWIYKPSGDGPWPIAYALPGSGGEAQRDMGVLAAQLAEEGVLVFATDWSVDLPMQVLERDAECGYRYVRSIAEEHGGDLSQPVTMIGFSLGADAVLPHGLSESAYGPEATYNLLCMPGVPRPEVVVSLQGCFNLPNFEGLAARWGNKEAELVLMSGLKDTVCPPFRSKAAEIHLADNGYDVILVEVADAKHGGLVFHDIDNDWAEYPADYGPGQRAVEAILGAISSAQ